MTGASAGLAILVVLGCGGGSTEPERRSGNTPPPAGGITVFNDRFAPDTKIVAPGVPVQWGWNTCTGAGGYGGGETCVAHNVTFADGNSSTTQEVGSFTRSFTAPGTYDYRCTLHPTFMTGTVRVE
jgi:plastocyanin